MIHRISLIVIVLIWSSSVTGQVVLDQPMSSRLTAYNIDARLDTDAKTIHASMEAMWVNDSPGEVIDIQMHMYLNAFRSNKSTFYLSSGGGPGLREIDYGYVDILSLSDSQGEDLTGRMEYIQPDDGNEHDMTVLRVPLSEPVEPGDTLWLNIEFVSKLPSTIRRTGFTGDFFFVAQWFPKFGVYESRGMGGSDTDGWNCHQFHNNSEFYANHSVYNVNVTLPTEYITGSGGMLIDEQAMGDSLKVVSWRAEDIVDFAWTAWPDYQVAEDTWEHVSIRFLYPPGREDQVERQMQAVKNALEYLDERVGPYPWPHLTFVDPPTIGGGAGGMEYTTIFTSASATGIPEWIHMPEMVTVHEFGHAYFMGILASNEFEEPWVDEGINSYWETRIMDHYWGPEKGLVNHPLFWLSDKMMQRLQYVKSPQRFVTDNTPASWEYPHGTYGMMSYAKAAVWLSTLEGIIGTPVMDEVFREYYRQWGFRHPTGEDFVDVTNEVVKRLLANRFPDGMDWFFDQTLYGTGDCDYRIAGIVNRKARSYRGVMRSDTGMVVQEIKDEADTLYYSTVRLERMGEVMVPLEIMVWFDDSTSVTEEWDGKARYFDLEYHGAARVTSARIDPEMKILMDTDISNNSMTTEPDHVPVRKSVRKMAALIHLFTQLLTI
jgi:hypothetical protein